MAFCFSNQIQVFGGSGSGFQPEFLMESEKSWEISLLSVFLCFTWFSFVFLDGGSNLIINLLILISTMKKETWKFILQTLASILTAIATTLGVTSCIWPPPDLAHTRRYSIFDFPEGRREKTHSSNQAFHPRAKYKPLTKAIVGGFGVYLNVSSTNLWLTIWMCTFGA